MASVKAAVCGFIVVGRGGGGGGGWQRFWQWSLCSNVFFFFSSVHFHTHTCIIIIALPGSPVDHCYHGNTCKESVVDIQWLPMISAAVCTAGGRLVGKYHRLGLVKRPLCQAFVCYYIVDLTQGNQNCYFAPSKQIIRSLEIVLSLEIFRSLQILFIPLK